jgi:hypothetical protein
MDQAIGGFGRRVRHDPRHGRCDSPECASGCSAASGGARSWRSFAVPAPVAPTAIAAWLIARRFVDAARAMAGRLLSSEDDRGLRTFEGGWPRLRAMVQRHASERHEVELGARFGSRSLIVGTAGGGLELFARDTAGTGVAPPIRSIAAGRSPRSSLTTSRSTYWRATKPRPPRSLTRCPSPMPRCPGCCDRHPAPRLDYAKERTA